MKAIKNIFHKDHKQEHNTDRTTQSAAVTAESLQHQGRQRSVSNVMGPTVKHVNAPVVQEVRHRVETEIIQPVVQRDHMQTKVEQIIQPIVDKQVVPEVHRTVRDQVKEIVVGHHQAVPALDIKSRVEEAGIEHRRVVNQPLVSERVSQTIRQEITPVIQREVIMPRVIHHEQPIHERVIETPTVSTQTAAPISMQEASRMGLTTGALNQMQSDSLNRNMMNMSVNNTSNLTTNSSTLNDNSSMLNSNSVVGTGPLNHATHHENSMTSRSGGTSAQSDKNHGGLLDKLNPLHHGHKHDQTNMRPSTTTTPTQTLPTPPRSF